MIKYKQILKATGFAVLIISAIIILSVAETQTALGQTSVSNAHSSASKAIKWLCGSNNWNHIYTFIFYVTYYDPSNANASSPTYLLTTCLSRCVSTLARVLMVCSVIQQLFQQELTATTSYSQAVRLDNQYRLANFLVPITVLLQRQLQQRLQKPSASLTPIPTPTPPVRLPTPSPTPTATSSPTQPPTPTITPTPQPTSTQPPQPHLFPTS